MKKALRHAALDDLNSKGENRFGKTILAETRRLLGHLIPKGCSVLDIGCGNGNALAKLEPARGVGIDCSKRAIETAKKNHPDLDFHEMDAEEKIDLDGAFDFVLLNNVVGDLLDVLAVFENVKPFCTEKTRIVVTYYNILWDPAIKLTTWLGMREHPFEKNWFSLADIETFFHLTGFEEITRGTCTLMPLQIPIVTGVINRILAKLPIVNNLNIVTYNVARISSGELEKKTSEKTVTVLVPTRNEKGNIAGTVERIPQMGSHTEILFVDGDSSDGTAQEIEKQKHAFKGKKDIRLMHQVPPNTSEQNGRMLKLGKGDAVRKGFAKATGDILMILDGDLTVPPEDLPKFYKAIVEGRAEFINGNRLSYPLEKESMRFLNLVANRIFGILFTWLLGQRVKDTLCGTKVLTKEAYESIAANRKAFGDFDPFGDFDLLFGAAKQNLKIADLPVRYRARTYGDIKIERFRHGWLLLKMCWFAFWKLKIRS